MLHPSNSPPLKWPKSPDHRHHHTGKLSSLTIISSLHRFLLFSAVVSLLLLLCARYSSLRRPPPPTKAISASSVDCSFGKIYVYDLPPSFNKDLITDCESLNPWNSRCDALSNNGFGRSAASDLAGIVPDDLLTSWYATDQFAAELIYHNRILSHPCRARDPDSAAAFYVPFYAGLAVGKHLWSANYSADDRDLECRDLLRWIGDQEPWIRSGGRDHFIMLGRITWDFRRSKDPDWGSSFIYMPEMENVTRLLIERNPWDDRDVGVPYPTGFHPKSAAEVSLWQNFVLGRTRPALFSFAGAARPGFRDDFRTLLLQECARANGTCRSVDCSGGRCGKGSRETMNLFLDSRFCLQPRGDSFTRRSMFDCMLAGSIPVLFWRRSAYWQYGWYLPAEEGGVTGTGWSVFVDRRAVRVGAASVREVLEGIGEERVRRMRERVVEMIPRLVYGGAEGGIRGGVKDAFDVAVDGVLWRLRHRGNVKGNSPRKSRVQNIGAG